MALRLAPVYNHSIRFDENLPFYSWLEDHDFSRRMKPYGRIVKNNLASGVHLGVKSGSGRTSGVRYGYSQIANPVYLWRKSILSLDKALQYSVLRVVTNLVKMLRSEPWIDRCGRARGHGLAFLDIVRGGLHPTRILEFD